jgi:prefoldin subunit 5
LKRKRGKAVSRERLDDDLMMLRDMRERLNKMLATVKADPELERGELVHVTGELIKSLEAEIRALERAIGEIDERKGKVERSE